MDYSVDPFPDQVIFGNPNFSMSVSDSFSTSVFTSHAVSPVVTLPGYSAVPSSSELPPVDSPGLEAPPLSSGTLFILSTYTPHSLSFDPHPPLSTILPTPPVNDPVDRPNIPPCDWAAAIWLFRNPGS